MTLESIVTELGIIGKNHKVSSKYNPKALTSANEYIEKLEGIDIETKEGLKEYRKLTGYSTEDVSSGKTASNYRITDAGVNEIFRKYVGKHLKPITEELEEMTRSSIGYSFCPEIESKSEKYNTVKNNVYIAKDIIKTIKENPEEYINKQIGEAPDFMKAIIARFSDEVLQIDAQDAQRKAFRTIHEYGSAKFVTETHEHLESLKAEYITDMKALSEKEMEMKKEKPYLNTDESVEYFTEIKKAKDELKKREKQLEILPQLTDAIAQNAIATIQKREKSRTPKLQN